MSKSALITGVGGFIGAAVATRFRDKGWTVVGVDDLSTGYISNVPQGIEFYQIDLANASALGNITRRYDSILHLAGQSSGEISFDDPATDLAKNTTSLLNLINLSRKYSIEKLVYASSMSVYGSVPDAPINEDYPAAPLSCYGVGKLASENYLKVYSKELDSIALRMFNVYGPGQDLANLRQGMVSIYLAQALKRKRIVVKGSLSRFRDFIFIDDVVDSWEAAVHANTSGLNVFNIGSGVKTTVAELLEKIQSFTGKVTIEESGGTPGDQYGVYADISAAKTVLNYEAKTGLDRGIKLFLDAIGNGRND